MNAQPLDAVRIAQMANAPLDTTTVSADPLAQFDAWYEEAEAAGIFRADAMTLSTVKPDGSPAARVVLYKKPEMLGIEAAAFPFFTNFKSAKGGQLSLNANAALTFYWKEPGRQVRIEGKVERLADSVSDAYFATRPRDSQIGAWASPQSQAIENREFMEKKVRALEAEYEGRDVPRPPHWGGYLVTPHTIEFWQHRDSRLHDRVRYTRQENGGWQIARISP